MRTDHTFGSVCSISPMSFHGVALESVTQRTLHAHGFSRSSSQASQTLSDLLSRYLTLLSSTCAKYAQHAGRTGLTAMDAFCALDDLGVSVDELGEYCLSEGRELRHYAVLTARRMEDLNELKGYSLPLFAVSLFLFTLLIY